MSHPTSMPTNFAGCHLPRNLRDLAKPVTDAVEVWLRDHKGTGLVEQAALDFELTLFSNASDNGLPLLRLDGLSLALADITARCPTAT